MELSKIKIKPFRDFRGEFYKLFSDNFYSKLKKKNKIEEISISISKKKGTIRGLHYQNYPYTEDKIITCIRGSIFDVVVDLRKNSSDFLKIKTFFLSSINKESIFVPKGFAHGFQTLEKNCEVLYFNTKEYKFKFQVNINPFSKLLNIKWPVRNYILSDQDNNGIHITKNYQGLIIKK
jgi:dTDP-4-dehydrorhamnose 3,5-epimerase